MRKLFYVDRSMCGGEERPSVVDLFRLRIKKKPFFAKNGGA
jgi:hypothetical protein